MLNVQDPLATADLAIQTILAQVRLKHLALPDWQAEVQNFIPMCGVWHANAEHSFTLDSEMANFMANDKKVLLLVGNSGCGKSLYTQGLSVELWQEYSYDKPIPLWISLPGLKNPTTQAIEETLENYGFNAEQIEYLRQTARFIFILDAYDEVKNLKNLYVSNNLSNWQAKVIITCRSEHLYYIENYKSFFVPFNGERALYSAYTEIRVNLFNEQQIQEYIQVYTYKQSRNEQTSFYQQAIAEIPGLLELITTPFILKLALEILPEIIAKFKSRSENENGDEVSRKKLTQAALYDVFVEQWFLRQEQKLKDSGHIASSEDIKPEFWAYAKELAQTMHQQGVTQIYYTADESDLFDEPDNINLWEKFFNPVHCTRLALLLPACMIREVSMHKYAFMHTSLGEYFFTKKLTENLYMGYAITSKSKDTSTSITASTSITQSVTQEATTKLEDDYFNQKLLVKETSNIQFLADRVVADEIFKQSLFAKIYASKNNPQAKIAAANAMTILNRAKVSFSGMDLSSIQIEEAILDDSILYDTDLSNSNLSNVVLKGAIIERASFYKSNLHNIILGEQPILYGGENEPIPFWCICFSSDGRLLAGGNARGVIHIWDMYEGEKLHSIHATQGKVLKSGLWMGDWVKSICFSPDNSIIASGSGFNFTVGGDTAVRIWDVKSGKRTAIFNHHTALVQSVCFNPDGTLLASGSCDNSICIVNVLDNTKVCVLEGHTRSVNSVQFSADGKFLLSGSDDYTIRIWDLSTFQTIDILQTDGRVTVITFSPDGNFLAATSESSIWLWNFSSRTLINKYIGDTSHGQDLITAISFSPDQRLLVSSTSYTGQIYVWNINDVNLSYRLTEESDKCVAIKFLPHISIDGKYLIAAGTFAGNIKFLEVNEQLKTKSSMALKKGHFAEIFSSSYSQKIGLLVSGGQDALICWDITQRSIVKHLDKTKFKAATHVCLSPNANLLAIGCDEIGNLDKGEIIVWDLEKDAVLYSMLLTNSGSNIGCLAFNPKGSLLVCGGFAPTSISIWDMSNGELVYEFRFDHFILMGCRSVCFQPNSDLFIAGTGDGDTHVFDALKKEKICTLKKEHTYNIACIAFNADGSLMVSGSWDTTICVWSMQQAATGKLLYKINTHKSRLESISISPNGRFLASGSNCIVSIWDLLQQREICRIIGHNNKVSGIHFINDNQIVTSCWDHAIRIWNLQEQGKIIQASLEWISHSVGLQLKYVNIIEAYNLSKQNKDLLKQHGAIDKPPKEKPTIPFDMLLKMMLSSQADDIPSSKSTQISQSNQTNPLARVLLRRTDNNSDVMEILDEPSSASSADDKEESQSFIALGSIPIRVANQQVDKVTCISCANNGKLLAAATSDVFGSPGIIYLYKANCTLLDTFIDGHTRGIKGIAFHPNNNLLASGGYDRSVCLWNIKRRKLLHTFKGGDIIVEYPKDAEDFEQILNDFLYPPHFPFKRKSPLETNIIAFIFSPTLQVWKAYLRQSENAFEEKTIDVHSTIAQELQNIEQTNAESYNTANLYKLLQANPLFDNPILFLNGHTQCVASVAFHPNGNLLASGAWDKTIRIWDLASKQLVHIFEDGIENQVNGIMFNAQGSLLASIDGNCLRLWDIDARTLYHSFKEHKDKLTCIAFNPDGNRIASGSEDNSICLWDIENLELVRKFVGHKLLVTSIAFHPNGELLISGSWDNTVRVWNINKKREIHIFKEQVQIKNVLFHPVTGGIVAIGEDNTIRRWHIGTIEEIINNNESEGINVLVNAAKDGKQELIKCLLKSGVAIDGINQEGTTALCIASLKGQEAIVELLIAYKANVNYSDQQKNSPLMLAVATNNYNIALLLLQAGANVDYVGDPKEGVSSLYIAAQRGFINIVELLLKNGATVDNADKNGNTPLLLAAEHGHTDVVNRLLIGGANINHFNAEGMTALFLAILYDRMETILLLLESDVAVNHADNNGNTALLLAVAKAQEDIVVLLLKKGANANTANNNKITPLNVALQKDNFALLQLLSQAILRNMYAVDAKRQENEHQNVEQGLSKSPYVLTKSEITRKLLRDSANQEVLADDDYEKLIEMAVSLDVHLRPNNDGNTALHLVFITKQPTKVIVLLREIVASDKEPIIALQMKNLEGITVLDLYNETKDSLPAEAIELTEKILRCKSRINFADENIDSKLKGRKKHSRNCCLIM